MTRPVRSDSRQILLLSAMLLLVSSLSGCVSPSNQATKPNQQCVCGTLLDLEQKPYCAIWTPLSRTDKAQAAIRAVPQANCQPADCSRLFSDDCEKIQMAPASPPTEAGKLQQACYCDSLLIENDKGQVQNVCAAWAEGASHVLEYYAVENCSPQRCAESPFVKAPRLCKQGFRSFYLPIQNQGKKP